ncbi:hypothetical protein ACOSP7_003459 [Xanthoceras sorbifolium]
MKASPSLSSVVFLVLALFLCQSLIADSVFFNKFRVHLINDFKNSTLEAHCKSKRGNDLGHQHIPVHQEFSWKFYTDLFGKTRYYCDLGWSNGRKGMDIFKIKDDFLDAYCGYDFCRWLFKEDSSYSYYFKHKQFQFQFKRDK